MLTETRYAQIGKEHVNGQLGVPLQIERLEYLLQFSEEKDNLFKTLV